MSVWGSGYVTEARYSNSFHRSLTPALLKLACMSSGNRFPHDSSKLNYCELGCGMGYSSNLLAAANPNITFWANDFMPTHITHAQQLASEAGLSNVHFFEQSFEEFTNEPGLPMLDIIALHGLYSWVDRDARQDIVNFVKKKLKPGGVVLLSYNALPGWTPLLPMQKIMATNTAVANELPYDRFEAGLDILSSLEELGAIYLQDQSVVAKLDKIKESWQIGGERERSYLLHEYLNLGSEAFYHTDVAEKFAEAKLDYFCSSNLESNINSFNITPQQHAFLSKFKSASQRETLKDYITNATFRSDIFLRGDSPLSPTEAEDYWLNLTFTLSQDESARARGFIVPTGKVAYDSKFYESILYSLVDGPKTLAQLLDEHAPDNYASPARLANALADTAPLSGKRGTIQIALMALIAFRVVEPCLPQDSLAERASSARAFNMTLLRRAAYSMDYAHLASPVTGGGIMLDNISQLILLARYEGRSDTVDFIMNIFEIYGKRLYNEDTLIEDETELRTKIEQYIGEFSENMLPVLEYAGIA